MHDMARRYSFKKPILKISILDLEHINIVDIRNKLMFSYNFRIRSDFF